MLHRDEPILNVVPLTKGLVCVDGNLCTYTNLLIALTITILIL